MDEWGDAYPEWWFLLAECGFWGSRTTEGMVDDWVGWMRGCSLWERVLGLGAAWRTGREFCREMGVEELEERGGGGGLEIMASAESLGGA